MSGDNHTQNSSKDIDIMMEELSKDLADLYYFRDHFFELHSLEDNAAALKNKLLEEKKELLLKRFDEIDDNEIPMHHRAKYFYMKGRTYNVLTKYDSRSVQYLNRAIKLNPRLVDAWNELGDSYWKNIDVKEAKVSFEGALKQERNRVSLRSLSIILRQEATHSPGDQSCKQIMEKSVELAKEAVSQDPKDGLSWIVLGNANLCKYFLVAQDPATLKSGISAYKQATLDPVARGHPDLYYNHGLALKFEEQYGKALECFTRASLLDPSWEVPDSERTKLLEFLIKADELTRNKGKIKAKKLQQMVQSLDTKALEKHSETSILSPVTVDELQDGENKGTFVVGKVIGSIHTDNLVPFTFALIDGSMKCVIVNVYNWARGRGVIINDSVAMPEPLVLSHTVLHKDKEYKFRSIRINNPTTLLVNGKKINRNQVAGVSVTSTYEVYC